MKPLGEHPGPPVTGTDARSCKTPKDSGVSGSCGVGLERRERMLRNDSCEYGCDGPCRRLGHWRQRADYWHSAFYAATERAEEAEALLALERERVKKLAKALWRFVHVCSGSSPKTFNASQVHSVQIDKRTVEQARSALSALRGGGDEQPSDVLHEASAVDGATGLGARGGPESSTKGAK